MANLSKDKRSQHAKVTYRNIVGPNMLRSFGHPVATCCDVGSNLSQQHPTRRTEHIATRWPNVHNMLHPTMLRYVALARALNCQFQCLEGLILETDPFLESLRNMILTRTNSSFEFFLDDKTEVLATALIAGKFMFFAAFWQRNNQFPVRWAAGI